MRTFIDERGQTWDLRLDVSALERCAAVGIHLDEVLSGKSDLLIRLRFDAPLIARTLAAICRPAFPLHQVKTDEEFIALLTPAVLGRAKALLRDELVGFFTQFDPGAGRPLQLWLEKDKDLARMLAPLAVSAAAPLLSSGAGSGGAPGSAA